MKVPDKLIKSLDELYDYIMNNPSIYVTAWQRAHPTSFFISWHFMIMARWLKAKRFYTVKDKKVNK